MSDVIRRAFGERNEHDWPDDPYRGTYFNSCGNPDCRVEFLGPKRAPLCWKCWGERGHR